MEVLIASVILLDLVKISPILHDIFNSAWVFTLEPKMLEPLVLPIELRFYSESGDGRIQPARPGYRRP